MTDKDGNQLLDAAGNHADMKCLTLVKYKGWDVAEVLHKDPGYYSWMLASEFHL